MCYESKESPGGSDLLCFLEKIVFVGFWMDLLSLMDHKVIAKIHKMNMHVQFWLTEFRIPNTPLLSITTRHLTNISEGNSDK